MFAGWRGDNIDSRLQDVQAFLEHDVGVAAAEDAAEEALEIGSDRLQAFGKQASAIGVDFVDDAGQRIFGVDQVLVLIGQRRVALLQRFDFLEAAMLTAPILLSRRRRS